MSLELMGKINDNYHMAICAHKELADIYDFIGLKGYSLWHEFNYLSEILTQRKIKNYITKTYKILLPDRLPVSADISEKLLSGKNRKELKPEKIFEITKETFRIYLEWEETTLQGYQRAAKQIFDSGDTSTFNFVSKLVKSVKAELDYVTDKAIELTAMDWDMTVIVDEQKTYVERYEYLIDNLLGKPRKYHHWNSNVDAVARAKIFEKYPD